MTRKRRSLKFVTHSASADGTNGRPNAFIRRSNCVSNCSPSWKRR